MSFKETPLAKAVRLQGLQNWADKEAAKHQGRLVQAYSGFYVFWLNDYRLELNKTPNGWRLHGCEFTGFDYDSTFGTFKETKGICNGMCLERLNPSQDTLDRYEHMRLKDLGELER